MIKRRQRSLGLLVAAVWALLAACSSPAGNTTTTAPTAIATVAAVATSVAKVSATGQALAPGLSNGLTQLAPDNLGRLIGTTIGVSVEVSTTPANVSNDQVTQATLNGTDRSNVWVKLDQQARQAFAGAGLQLARQAYPKAQLEMTVVDTSGNRLLSASYPPGGTPSFQ